jgi:threonine dehydratase
LRHSPWLSTRTGGEIRIKIETLQPTFSYKIRGALNAVLRMVEDREAPRELVTASAGNHGRALAMAAAALGVPLTVYVPAQAPQIKLAALDRAGARIVSRRDYDEAERAAKEDAARGTALYISPYSHPDVIAGAGTIGLEILADAADTDLIVVAVGGGGLTSGVAIAAAGRADVHGVEAEASCPFTRGFEAGRIVPIEVGQTLADGLAGNLDPDTITFDIVRQHVANIVTVSEAEIAEAIAGLFLEERLVAEGAAGTAVAGVLSGRIPARGRRVAIVLTGANIDPETLIRIIRGGQA